MLQSFLCSSLFVIRPRSLVLIESFVHRLYKVPFVFADSGHVMPKISFLLEAKTKKKKFISFKRLLIFLSLLQLWIPWTQVRCFLFNRNVKIHAFWETWVRSLTSNASIWSVCAWIKHFFHKMFCSCHILGFVTLPVPWRAKRSYICEASVFNLEEPRWLHLQTSSG